MKASYVPGFDFFFFFRNYSFQCGFEGSFLAFGQNPEVSVSPFYFYFFVIFKLLPELIDMSSQHYILLANVRMNY